MRVLMTGGGTGGHVNPALAIAETIKKNCPDSEIAFVGTDRGLENVLVPRAGYRLYHVNVRGFKRSLSLENIRSAWLALISPLKAAKIVKEFKPDIVIGTGGYASWPIIVAASRKGIPTAVHEANAVPGLTVRKLVPYVDTIFTNFKVSEQGLGAGAAGKTMHVGCPVFDNVGTGDREEARRKYGIKEGTKYIVSFGGSLGAEAMNKAAFDFMKEYVAKTPTVRYSHACGERYYKEYSEKFAAEGLNKYENIELLEYIYDMPDRLAAADLIICRSGAITCSELSRAGKASILIPSPNVTDNQQVKNATVLQNCGGAVMIEEKDLTTELLSDTVDEILSTSDRTDEMGRKVKEVSPSDANERIFKEIVRLVK